MRNINHLTSFLTANNFRPEYLAAIIEQGIEIERIKCQIEEATTSENYETMVRLLQGERFLLILSASRLT